MHKIDCDDCNKAAIPREPEEEDEELKVWLGREFYGQIYRKRVRKLMVFGGKFDHLIPTISFVTRIIIH